MPTPKTPTLPAPGQVPTFEHIADLLREARDTVQASIAEDGISDDRRKYRNKLYTRICAALAKLSL